MRVSFYLTGMIVFLFILFVAGLKHEGMEIEEIQNKLTELHKTTDKITSYENHSIEYMNPYTKEFGFSEFISNTAHWIFYSITREMHSVVGLSLNLGYKYITMKNAWYLIYALIIYLTIKVIEFTITPTLLIYTILEEKYIKKGKWWMKLLSSIGILCGILTFWGGLVYLILKVITL